MDPVSWIAIASAVIGAASAASTAEANASNARAQAQAAQTNATIAQNNAHNSLLVADANEEAQRRKSAYELGQQRASLLSAGIGAEGSPLDVYAQSVGNAELDGLNIRYQGQVQANNYLNQAGMDRAQAAASLVSADNAETAGDYAVAASLIGGAGKVASAQAKAPSTNGG